MMSAAREIKRMNRFRDFPVGTCPASRHVAIMAEALAAGRPYPMVDEDPEHVAESLASAVGSLWQARRKLRELGYMPVADNRGVVRYRKVRTEGWNDG